MRSASSLKGVATFLMWTCHGPVGSKSVTEVTLQIPIHNMEHAGQSRDPFSGLVVFTPKYKPMSVGWSILMPFLIRAQPLGMLPTGPANL